MISIRFLGTGGARFVVARQIRASGGMWMRFGATQIHVDPGPGALVRALSAVPPCEPPELDAIVLSHKHLDHANDVNVMIEAMCQGGWKRRGAVLAPNDAFDFEPVILPYVRAFVPREERLTECGGPIAINDVEIRTSIRHRHAVETYGLHFRHAGTTISSTTTARTNRTCSSSTCCASATPWTSITSRSMKRARSLRGSGPKPLS
jgi:phosphoribosyl 1,2-cyclic phosphodiesterase